jgi:signal transduction histidine kinase
MTDHPSERSMTDHPPEDLAVLLVEDNPGDVRLIERHVERMDTELLASGVQLRSVERLSAAVEALDAGEFDLVLLDLGLPDSQGLATLETVDQHAERLPVIVLTVLDDKSTAVEAIKSGAQDYLYKGKVDEETLARTMRYAVERNRRERELRERSRQLEVLTSILRHDVRTDVSVIRASTKMVLEDESLSDSAEQRLEAIGKASSHVDGLIQTTREYVESVFDDGDVDPRPVALPDVLSNAVRSAETTFEEAEFEVDDVPDAEVMADEMLSSVFRNLLNNAVQHNDKETPYVEVTVERVDDCVAVSVADNGPGIPDTVTETVFGADQRTVQRDGSGIGLHLVAELVDRYDGTVDVDDNDPAGAEVTVRLQTAE